MILLTSTFTADIMRSSLESLLNKFSNQKTQFLYNQLFQQAILPNSEFNENTDGLNVILIRLIDLFVIEGRKESSNILDELKRALDRLHTTMHVPLLILIVPSIYKNQEEKEYYFEIEKQLAVSIGTFKNTTLINSTQIIEHANTELIFDNFTEKHGHIPYTLEFYHSLSYLVSRTYSLLIRKPYKVIVLDCDGTLWNGIIEEDGLNKIRVDSYFIQLHRFIIECYEAGFLICLCSKNKEESVLSVFKNHKDMVLDIEKHICTYRINWELKSANIKSIAKELDLGLDSFIFIDDNKVECAEVRAAIPQMLVIDLPGDIKKRVPYLKKIWAFDSFKQGIEDTQRTKFYQTNKLRNQLKAKSISFTQFLDNLKIKIEIQAANIADFDRVHQLSKRTNQFNLLPDALTNTELYNSIKSGQPQCLTIKVTDKFGDYGLVGVLIYEIQNSELIVKSYCLSCRILGRGVEYQILKRIGEIAETHDIRYIKILFRTTEKNIPAIAFIKHISGLEETDNLNFVKLTVETCKTVSISDGKTEKKQSIAFPDQKEDLQNSNDFMLKIAEDFSKKPQKLKNKTTFSLTSIKLNLLELLKYHGVKINKTHSSLVALGINSLQSVMIAGSIYEAYQIELKPFELLHPDFSIDMLMEKILNEIQRPTTHVSTEELLFDTMYRVPLSNAQKRLWYDEKIAEKKPKNNLFVAYEVSNIDKSILQLSFNKIIERNDVFRCVFNEENNEPFIQIRPLSEINFKIDCIVNPTSVELDNYINEFKYTPFDLSSCPLIRVALINSEKQILLICVHHIIYDGWSHYYLLKELNSIYNAYAKGFNPSLPKANSYIDFIHQEQKYLTESHILKQKKFWEKKLDHLQKIELFHDDENDLDKKCAKRINFEIDNATTKKLKQVSINNQSTLYDVLLTVFGIFVSHYTNQDDIHFVTAVSGRNSPYTNNVIGFFVNLLILRLSIDNKINFLELLKKNKRILEDVFVHQELPFIDTLDIIGESATFKAHSFNQVGFIFQNYPTCDLELNEFKSNRIFADDKGNILYDSCQECRFGNLVFFMQETNGHLQGLVEYNAHLFQEKTILCMISAFKVLLKNIIKFIDSPAISIPLLNHNESKILFQKWNLGVKNRESSNYEHLLTYFSKQVEQTPNKKAVIYDGHSMSYGEIDLESTKIARLLISIGIEWESPVGIFLDSGIERVIALLAVIKAGACYLPLEKDMPSARIKYIVKDSALSCMITNNKLASHLEKLQLSINLLNLDEKKEAPTNITLPSNYSIKQLACILYTSGSTGAPKGVMIEQQGVVRLVKSTNYIKINSNDRVAQTSNFIFDAATLEIWGALSNGATLVLIDKPTLLNASLFSETLKKERISFLFLTTQLFHSYSLTAPNIFKGLKYLIVGGEAVLTEAVKHIFTQENHPRFFINGYGPTENTTFSTTYTIKKASDIVDPIPIGRPITGTSVYILGRNLNPMPIGAPGNLYVGGIGLARMYLNNEVLTQERFINYFGERLYNTGDIALWQPNGNIRYLGRKDNQVKINGYRIEPQEIEIQLEHHPLVEQAIVLIKNKNHNSQLAAYILLRDKHKLSDVNLHQFIKTILPRYMLPSAYYQIDNIPMTSNGKVDRHRLCDLPIEAVSYNEYESPVNQFQEKIINIYASILKINSQSIGINADFFDLGGNSISALTLVQEINSQFKVNINVSFLYSYSSIKLLSEELGKHVNSQYFSDSYELERLERSALKLIKPGSRNKIPIVFVHPIGGTGFCYLDLIKLLPADQPCYILQDPSIEANQILFDDISSMAKYYNQLLCNTFGASQIALAGFSFGGMLALEMVAQLEQNNLADFINCIISFDTWVVSNLLDIHAKEALKASIMQQYGKVANNLRKENIDPKPWMELYYHRLQELGFNYDPPQVNKKIILFKATTQLNEFQAMKHPTNYLGLHTKGIVEVHPIPGDHDTILQLPNVKQISNIVEDYFKEKVFED